MQVSFVESSVCVIGVFVSISELEEPPPQDEITILTSKSSRIFILVIID